MKKDTRTGEHTHTPCQAALHLQHRDPGWGPYLRCDDIWRPSQWEAIRFRRGREGGSCDGMCVSHVSGRDQGSNSLCWPYEDSKKGLPVGHSRDSTRTGPCWFPNVGIYNSELLQNSFPLYVPPSVQHFVMGDPGLFARGNPITASRDTDKMQWPRAAWKWAMLQCGVRCSGPHTPLHA